MKKIISSISLCLIAATIAAATPEKFFGQQILESVPLNRIHPEGWLHTMLMNQRNGLTGFLDTIAYPFNARGHGWGAPEPYYTPYKVKGNPVAFWVPYEQAGYYFDGAIRCGYLLGDEVLIEKGRTPIYNTIAGASPEGILESRLSQGDRCRWPHAVFFRAWMAEYEVTGDERIPDAMRRHFLNDTVVLSGRDLVNIESMGWLYRKTGDKAIYDKVMAFRNAPPGLHKEDEIGDFSSSAPQEIHGVTYNEAMKIPLTYYMLTGEKNYLDHVRNGFDKLDRYHMLPDGINSSEEGLSGKGSQNTHETCDIVDYIWICSYMISVTGETQWADRMERAVFNAGLGSITKNFDAHQYYSCPNQLFCGDYSSHVSSYSLDRFAYRQMHRPPCCTGNVNRMLPILAGSQWLTGHGGALYKAVYGPGSVEHNVNGTKMVLRERSAYPYSDEMTIEVVSGRGRFPLMLRIPGWCKTPKVLVNGVEQKNVVAGEYYKVEREFVPGDEVNVVVPKQAEFINWNGYDAMIVNYGPLLFALPVKAKVTHEVLQIPAWQKNPFYGYTMAADSDWNFILGVDGSDNGMIKVVTRPMTPEEENNPWIAQPQPLQLMVPMYQDATWKVRYQKVTTPAGEEIFAPITPPLPARGAMIFVLRKLTPRMKALVPYGSTQLRISMFPFWKETEIAPEILAAGE